MYRFTFVLTTRKDALGRYFFFHSSFWEISFLNHVLVGFPNIQWSANKYLTNGSSGKKIQMCNVYQFLWCIYFHLDQGQSTNITKCSSGKKCTLPSPAFTSQHQLALSYHCNACLPDATFKASAMEKLMFLRDIFKYIKLSHYNHISVFWPYT